MGAQGSAMRIAFLFAPAVAQDIFLANPEVYASPLLDMLRTPLLRSAKSTVVSCAAATGAPLNWAMDHVPSNDGRSITFSWTGALSKPPGQGTTFSATFDWDTNPLPGEPLAFDATGLCDSYEDGRETSTLPYDLGTFSVPTFKTCSNHSLGGVELKLVKLPGSLLPHTRWFNFHFEYGGDSPQPFACFDAHVAFTVW